MVRNVVLLKGKPMSDQKNGKLNSSLVSPRPVSGCVYCLKNLLINAATEHGCMGYRYVEGKWERVIYHTTFGWQPLKFWREEIYVHDPRCVPWL